MKSYENWQKLMAKLEHPPEETIRLRCLGALFGVFGDDERFIEYIEEAERLEGYGYWSDHYLIDGEIDFETLIKDMRDYLEDNGYADQG